MRRTESQFLLPDVCFYDLVCELFLHFSSIWPYRDDFIEKIHPQL